MSEPLFGRRELDTVVDLVEGEGQRWARYFDASAFGDDFVYPVSTSTTPVALDQTTILFDDQVSRQTRDVSVHEELFATIDVLVDGDDTSTTTAGASSTRGSRGSGPQAVMTSG